MSGAAAPASRRSSLQLTLLAWMLGALALVWGSFVIWGYQTGVHEADELTDGHLASVAALTLNGMCRTTFRWIRPRRCSHLRACMPTTTRSL